MNHGFHLIRLLIGKVFAQTWSHLTNTAFPYFFRTGKKKRPGISAKSLIKNGFIGGEEEDRTPDLCIANAALSQLSYPPRHVQSLAMIGTVGHV